MSTTSLPDLPAANPVEKAEPVSLPQCVPAPAERRRQRSLLLATVLISVLLAGMLSAEIYALIDTAANFQWQLVFLLALLTTWQLVRRRWLWAGLLAGVVAISALRLGAIMLPPPHSEPGPRPVRLLSLNLLEKNEDYDAVRQLIASSGAEIIAFSEYTVAWQQELEPALRDWKWTVGPASGNVIFSKLPMEEFLPSRRFFYHVDRMSVIGQVTIGEDETFLLFNTHTISPTTFSRLRYRDLQIRTLASVVGPLARWNHVVVIGDFNATTSCRSMQDLLNITGLRDSRQGFGTQSSWPVWFWPMAICIDHAFVNSGVHVHSRETGPRVGSDHLPVLVELSFAPRPKTE